MKSRLRPVSPFSYVGQGRKNHKNGPRMDTNKHEYITNRSPEILRGEMNTD